MRSSRAKAAAVALTATVLTATALTGCSTFESPEQRSAEDAARSVAHVTGAHATTPAWHGAGGPSLEVDITDDATPWDLQHVVWAVQDELLFAGTGVDVTFRASDGSEFRNANDMADVTGPAGLWVAVRGAIGPVDFGQFDGVWATSHSARQADALRAALPASDLETTSWHLDGIDASDSGLPSAAYTDVLYDSGATLVPTVEEGDGFVEEGGGIVLNVEDGGVPDFGVDDEGEMIEVARTLITEHLTATISAGALAGSPGSQGVHVGACTPEEVTSEDRALAARFAAAGVRVQPGSCS